MATSVVVVLVLEDVVQHSLTLVLEVVMQSKTRSLLVADFTSPACEKHKKVTTKQKNK